MLWIVNKVDQCKRVNDCIAEKTNFLTSNKQCDTVSKVNNLQSCALETHLGWRCSGIYLDSVVTFYTKANIWIRANIYTYCLFSSSIIQ